jgi:cytochrome P450
MTDQQLRDEVMTLFLAGHETTALMLSWAFFLLSQNPDAEGGLATELESVLGSREPSAADLPELRYTEAIIKETLRLYPPAWAFGRRALADSEIGGYRFPKGRQVAIFPWVIHRDPRSFEHPNEFRPDRWFHEKTRQLPKYAYLPFGGGPRVCIGNSFAMMEGSLVLASIARKYRMRLEPGQNVAPWPVFTLRPRNGIKMILAKRKALVPEPSEDAVSIRCEAELTSC